MFLRKSVLQWAFDTFYNLQATIKVIGLLKIDGGEGFKREKTT
jgi:hypothetical protein